jgi:hypothetical protein
MNIDRLHNTLHLLRNEEIVDFDLAGLVIDGKPVFEMGSIPRSKMPQLKGFPRKGSIAEHLPKDKHGKVNVSDEFLSYMTNVQKYECTYDRARASQLSGAQSELVAFKVAATVAKLWKNPEHKKFHQTYIVDCRGTLLDAHHGWASVRVYDLLQGTGGDTMLTVLRFDCSIEELINEARNFTTIIGIENKEGV